MQGITHVIPGKTKIYGEVQTKAMLLPTYMETEYDDLAKSSAVRVQFQAMHHQELKVHASVHYWNCVIRRVPRTLGKGPKTVSKTFAECCTRQKPPDVHLSGKQEFAESHLSDTRQKLCREPDTVTRQRKVIRRNGANSTVSTWR
jgi:hypothetical protein